MVAATHIAKINVLFPNGLSLGDDNLVRVMMVEHDFMGFMILDSSDTLVSKVFGKSKSTALRQACRWSPVS
jgi:hypothetical protein